MTQAQPDTARALAPSYLEPIASPSNLERIARYLAGKLSEPEARQFEAECAAREDLRRELELSLQIKEGLARLRDHGRLELRPRFWRSTPFRLALTGIAAALAIATALLLSFKPESKPLLTATAPVASPSSDTIPTYRFVSMRGIDARPVAIPAVAPVVLLQVRPNDPSPSGRYRVSLKQLGRPGEPPPIAQLTGIAPADDGFVTLYLRPSALSPGRYLLTVESIPGSSSPGKVEFGMEIGSAGTESVDSHSSRS